MLPDIDRINSTLDASGTTRKGDGAIRVPDPRQARRSGFRRGFAGVLLVAAIAWGIYAQAPRLVAAIPQVAPVVDAYVATVNQARSALDTLARGLLEQSGG